MYQCKHFAIHELVPKAMYESVGMHTDILWPLFNEDLLRGLDWLRDRYGSCVINNYGFSEHGKFEWSGLRTVDCPVYFAGSMHSVGMACDLKFTNHTAYEIRNDLRKLKNVPFITRIEDGVDWLHVDVKPTGLHEIYFFKP